MKHMRNLDLWLKTSYARQWTFTMFKLIGKLGACDGCMHVKTSNESQEENQSQGNGTRQKTPVSAINQWIMLWNLHCRPSCAKLGLHISKMQVTIFRYGLATPWLHEGPGEASQISMLQQCAWEWKQVGQHL